jgi:prepilin-type N-terminal cleavage/methylation domain-containing protein
MGSGSRISGSRKRGFTLVEILVVLAVFTVCSVAVTAIALNYTRLHQRTANAERLGEDLRYAMELIVRLARNRRIDYPALPGSLAAKTSVLPLVDTDGNRLVIQLLPKTNAACAGLNASCLAVSSTAYGTATAVTGKNVNVTRFDVYVTPSVTPFAMSGGAYNNDTQPRVTFVIDATYVATSTKESASIGVQTTIGSRVYVR